MTNSIWIFASSLFASLTNGNFRLMNLIASDHASKLKAHPNIPAILALGSRFGPVYLSYATLYSEWLATRGEYMAATQTFTDLLNLLTSEYIENWDARILAVYPSHTPMYRKLLPSQRSSYQRGAYDLRIREVERLITALKGDPALISLMQDVKWFYDSLITARDKQQTLERKISSLSNEVEKQRIVTANEMYYNLGGLMQYYYQDPIEVEGFFDLENIRSTGQGKGEEEQSPSVTLGVNPGATVDTGLSFSGDMLLRIVNTGTTALKLCMLADNSQPCIEGTLLQPGEEFSGSAATLGWTEGKILRITNDNTSIAGSVELYLI